MTQRDRSTLAYFTPSVKASNSECISTLFVDKQTVKTTMQMECCTVSCKYSFRERTASTIEKCEAKGF